MFWKRSEKLNNEIYMKNKEQNLVAELQAVQAENAKLRDKNWQYEIGNLGLKKGYLELQNEVANLKEQLEAALLENEKMTEELERVKHCKQNIEISLTLDSKELEKHVLSMDKTV